MNGYIKIRVMANGTYFDCFQKIEEGNVIGYVDVNNQPVVLPEVHESYALTRQLLEQPE